MPTYNFTCNGCNNYSVTRIFSMLKYDLEKDKLRCPECDNKLEQEIGVRQFRREKTNLKKVPTWFNDRVDNIRKELNVNPQLRNFS